jgi:hypothetical protein
MRLPSFERGKVKRETSRAGVEAQNDRPATVGSTPQQGLGCGDVFEESGRIPFF